MIQVKLPNGATAQFPDGMPNAEIEAVLQRQFGGQQQPDGPTIKVGDRVIPVAEYRAMSDEERQAIRSEIAQANPSVQTQSSWVEPLAQGMTFGWGDELASAAHGAGAALQGGDFGRAYAEAKDHYDNSLEHERRVNPVGSFAAEVGGAVLPSVLSGGAGLVAQGTSTLGRAAIGAGTGLAQGLVYGAGSANGDIEDRAKGAALSGTLGAGLGAAAPYIGQGLRRLITPFPASASTTAAARTLAGEGVELTAGQRTGSKGLQYLESEMGGAAASDLMERQAEQFTQAALRRAGVNAPRATPEVVDTAFDTIGQQFDRLAAVTDTPFDSALQNNLLGVAADYVDTAANPAPVVERLVNRLAELAAGNGGQISGRVYQEMRSTIGRLSKSADPATRIALREMQAALDDSIERHLSGQTLEAWRAVRRHYQNLLVIERAATSAGKNSADGLITPAQLRSAAVNQNRRAFARGRNDFGELANAGVSAMTPLPNSGTAARLRVQGLPAILGAGIGTPGGPLGAMAGAAAGAAIPAIIGRAALSRPGRALLANQRAATTDAGAVERILQTLKTPLVGRR